ncbi:MAG: exopolyphosphatase [Planctomycetes bacterium]|nr:exopolyphosphatase [Planctomycetota bacterium]
MHILTRGDMDGMTASVFLTIAEEIREIRFAHPKDVQDGLVPAAPDVIVVNLPHVKGCGMWFDHHVSEEGKLEAIGDFKGSFKVAPSVARVVYDHYKRPEFDPYLELLDATDRLDAAMLTKDEVANPSGWILLGLTLDPRTGLGPEFQKYFRWLVEYVKEVPLAKILQHKEVKRRCERVLKERDEFLEVLKKHTRLDGDIIITDFRGFKVEPVGNRFLVFTLFPDAKVEARLFAGKGGTVVVALGRSIFNRSLKTSLGDMLAAYGGGGHRGAGTAQLAPEKAEAQIAEILAKLAKDG